MTESEYRTQVAATILQQLGGRRFTGMTGAKHLAELDCGLGFKLPATLTKSRINACRITLEPSDTYTMRFYRMTAKELKLVSEEVEVYCDQLEDVFETHTGLFTAF